MAEPRDYWCMTCNVYGFGRKKCWCCRGKRLGEPPKRAPQLFHGADPRDLFQDRVMGAGREAW